MGLSGTSAGALCALMAWYGLAPIKNGRAGSVDEAIGGLERFWENFVAITGAETVLNSLTYGAIRAEESEVPVLGLYAPIFGLNPRGAIYKALLPACRALAYAGTILIWRTRLPRLVRSSTASIGQT